MNVHRKRFLVFSPVFTIFVIVYFIFAVPYSVGTSYWGYEISRIGYQNEVKNDGFCRLKDLTTIIRTFSILGFVEIGFWALMIIPAFLSLIVLPCVYISDSLIVMMMSIVPLVLSAVFAGIGFFLSFIQWLFAWTGRSKWSKCEYKKMGEDEFGVLKYYSIFINLQFYIPFEDIVPILLAIIAISFCVTCWFPYVCSVIKKTMEPPPIQFDRMNQLYLQEEEKRLLERN